MKGQKNRFERSDVHFIFSAECKRVYGSLRSALDNDPAPVTAKLAVLELVKQEFGFMVMNAIHKNED